MEVGGDVEDFEAEENGIKSSKLYRRKNKTDRFYFVHYGCGDFRAGDGVVCAIVVQHFAGSDAETFSIHREARNHHVAAGVEQGVEHLAKWAEKRSIEKFFEYLQVLGEKRCDSYSLGYAKLDVWFSGSQ